MNPYLLIDLKQSPKPAVPTNLDSTKALMQKLTHRSKIICALEAAKMVLPIWEGYAFKAKRLTEKRKEAPKLAIEIVEKWLKGAATANELKNAASYADSTATYVSTAIANAAKSADDYANKTAAADYAYAALAAANTANAVASYGFTTDYATHAVTNAAGTNKQFYLEWWHRCQTLIEKELQELQDKYDNLYNQISGGI